MRVGAAVLALFGVWGAGAAIVDRVSISVGNKVITRSNIDMQIRLTALENHVVPDFGLGARKVAARMMIDQKLVEHEMDLGHYPRTEDGEAKQLAAEYALENYHSDMPAMAEALAKDGLTTGDLQAYLAYRNDVLTFLNVRFRPAVSATEQNPAVAEKLADVEMEKWLAEQRSRIRIEYLEKELAP